MCVRGRLKLMQGCSGAVTTTYGMPIVLWLSKEKATMQKAQKRTAAPDDGHTAAGNDGHSALLRASDW